MSEWVYNLKEHYTCSCAMVIEYLMIAHQNEYLSGFLTSGNISYCCSCALATCFAFLYLLYIVARFVVMIMCFEELFVVLIFEELNSTLKPNL